jgi:xylulokinase
MDFADLTALAATSPPGANDVLFTPWLAGERSPIGNKHLRGGFTNLSLTTTTADLVRAVLEGVAANSAWLLTYVEKFAGRQLTPLRLLGGGAQSSEWCQIFADALSREVEQVPQPMVAQLRGAALLGAIGLGRHRLEDIASLRPRGHTFAPNAEHAALYRTRREQFPGLYTRDKKWSRSVS